MTGGLAGERVHAPFGVRSAPVTARRQYGSYTVLSCADPGAPRPQPGQFYMLRAARRWGGGEAERPFLPRAFSVLRTSELGELTLEFLIEAVGPGTQRLAELGAGDELYLLGPLGRGFARPRDGRRPLLVGGGVGIAPLAIWQDELGPDTPVLLGFRDEPHARGAALLSEPAVATDDGSVGRRGLVTELLAAAIASDPDVEVYACGPPGMLEAIRRLCDAHRIPAQLALEAGMACGYGACFGCVVPTADGLIRLCLEGPVLDAGELTEDTLAVPGLGHSG